jgi:Putative peptidoglycan binding domain
MSTTHTVLQGECLSSIAHDFGFGDWHVIYDHPQNASFKTKRPNPNLIYPGDELFIPDLTPRDDSCQTDMNHRFQLIAQPTYLNLRIQDPADKPIAGAKYVLTLDKLNLHGKTDGDGWIKHKIPPISEYGTLQVWPNPADHQTFFKWNLKLGHLDPLETTSGIKGRLNNLGYDCGEVDSTEDELYDQAVRQFQQDHNLEVDGIVGPQTRNKLKQEHRI